jgi:hypothetical protein
VTPGVDDICDSPELEGPARPRPVASPVLPWLCAFGPWALLAALLGVRAFVRRRAADPLGLRARAAAVTCARALAHGGDPTAALTGYLGDRLGVPAAAVIGPDLGTRLAAAGVAPGLATAVVEAVERGIAARYGGGGGLDAALVRELVARLEQRPPRRLPSPLWLLALVLLGAAPARAQQDGYTTYRQGDYAAAAAAFAHAIGQTDDRRLWFALGNSHYRLGDLPRALWAWECARLGLPRDPELLANLELARRKLQLGGDGGEPFLAALAALRGRCTADELALLCGLCMALAAALLGLGWRRPAVRWLGVLALVIGSLLAAEVLWLAPQRPPKAVALSAAELVAEPRAGLQPVATVQAGVLVELRGAASGEWVRVAAGERSGYARRELLGIVE